MNVQKKLFNYSEEPPAAAWTGILAALEETPAYAQKLHRFEQEPPEQIWQQVSQTLHTPAAPVISLRTKLFKYAIAAIVLTVIAASSLFYVKNQMAAPIANLPQNNTTDGANTNKPSDTQAHTQPMAAETPDADNSTGNNPDLIADNNQAQRAVVQFSHSVRIGNSEWIGTSEPDIMPEEINLIDLERTNRYMIATSETGKAVRLPKKAYSAYACADVYTNPACKEKIAFIQSKMAASVATDFTNFMDLLKTLQDN